MKSVVLWREPSGSRGMSITKGGPTNQVVPCAFSNHASVPQIGYKLPFSTDLERFSERLNRQNDDISEIATQYGEGDGRLFIGSSLLTRETAPSSTFCRACPQYGHALIFPRKCYYEAQCPLPNLFSMSTDGENHATVGVPPEIEGPRCEGKIAPVQGQRVKKQPNSPGLTRLHPGRGTDNISDEKEPRRALLWGSSVDTIHHGERPVKRPSIRGVVLASCLRYAQNFLPRLSSTLSKKIAYNDPTRENTNFGWRRRE